ncbi:MAG: hypothetical protein QXN68_00525 [Thermoplasmata archaeon]
MTARDLFTRLELTYIKNGWLFVNNRIFESELSKYRIDLEAYNPDNGRIYYFVYDRDSEKLNHEIIYSFGLYLTKEYRVNNYAGYIVYDTGKLEPVLICDNKKIKEIKEKKEYLSKQGLDVVLEFLLKKLS